jgi:NADH-quinone oxidoreductase subunit G
LDIKGFDYMSSEEVRDELKATIDQADKVNSVMFSEPKPMQSTAELQRIGTVQMYAGDSLVRRASALQQAAGDQRRNVTMHPEEITRLALQANKTVSVMQGDSSVRMNLVADNAIPIGCALIPAATQKSTELGAAFGTVQITKG